MFLTRELSRLSNGALSKKQKERKGEKQKSNLP
jgi:hypothetical protein